MNGKLLSLSTPTIPHPQKIASLLLRPQIDLKDLIVCIPNLNILVEQIPSTQRAEILDIVQTNIKYENYILKEQETVDRINKYESLIIKDDFDYMALKSLSFEAREKLTKIRPHTIGQASRISGVSPADISVLILYISR